MIITERFDFGVSVLSSVTDEDNIILLPYTFECYIDIKRNSNALRETNIDNLADILISQIPVFHLVANVTVEKYSKILDEVEKLGVKVIRINVNPNTAILADIFGATIAHALKEASNGELIIPSVTFKRDNSQYKWENTGVDNNISV